MTAGNRRCPASGARRMRKRGRLRERETYDRVRPSEGPRAASRNTAGWVPPRKSCTDGAGEAGPWSRERDIEGAVVPDAELARAQEAL